MATLQRKDIEIMAPAGSWESLVAHKRGTDPSISVLKT